MFKAVLTLIFLCCAALRADTDSSPGTAFFGISGTKGDQSFGVQAHLLADFVVGEISGFKFFVGPSIDYGLGSYEQYPRMTTSTDISVSGRANYRFEWEKNDLDLYVRVPVGLSMVGLSKYSSKSELSMGYNVGVIPGLIFSFNKLFGIFMELGFLQRNLYAVTSYSKTIGASAGWASVGLAIDW